MSALRAARALLALGALSAAASAAWGSAITDIAGPGCTETVSQPPVCEGNPVRNRLRLWLDAFSIDPDDADMVDASLPTTTAINTDAASTVFPTPRSYNPTTLPTEIPDFPTTARVLSRWPDRSGFGNDAVPLNASRVVADADRATAGAVMVPRVQRYFPSASGLIDCGDPMTVRTMVPYGRPAAGCTAMDDMNMPVDLGLASSSTSAPALNPPVWGDDLGGSVHRYPIPAVGFFSVLPLVTALMRPTSFNGLVGVNIHNDYRHECTIANVTGDMSFVVNQDSGHACDVLVTEGPLAPARVSAPNVEVFMVAFLHDPNGRQTLFNLATPADGGYTGEGDFRVRFSSDYEHEVRHRPSGGRTFSENRTATTPASHVTQQRADKIWFIAAPGTDVRRSDEGACASAPGPSQSCAVADRTDDDPSDRIGPALSATVGVDDRLFGRRSFYLTPATGGFYAPTDPGSDDSPTERRVFTRYPQLWHFASSVSQQRQSISLQGVELASDRDGHALYIPDAHVASWGWGFNAESNSPSAQMNLHEFLVFFAPLNSAERRMLHAALALKWGIVLPPDVLQFEYPQPTDFMAESSNVCYGGTPRGGRDPRGNSFYETLFCAMQQTFRWGAARQLWSERMGGIGRVGTGVGVERIDVGSSGPLTLGSPAGERGFLSRAGANPNEAKFFMVTHGELNAPNIPMRYYDYRRRTDIDPDTGEPFNMRQTGFIPGPESDGEDIRDYGMNRDRDTPGTASDGTDSSGDCRVGADGRAALVTQNASDDDAAGRSGFTNHRSCWDASPYLVENGVYPSIAWLFSTINVDAGVTAGQLADQDAEDNDLVTLTFRLADMGYEQNVRQRGALPGLAAGQAPTIGANEAWDPWPIYGFNYQLSFWRNFVMLHQDSYTNTRVEEFHNAVNACRLGINDSTFVTNDKARCKPTGQCALDDSGGTMVVDDADDPDTFRGMPVAHGRYDPGEPTIGPTADNDADGDGIHDGAEDDTVSFTLDAGHFAKRDSNGNFACQNLLRFTLRIHDFADPKEDLGLAVSAEVSNRHSGSEGLWLGRERQSGNVFNINEGSRGHYQVLMFPRPAVRWDYAYETALRVRVTPAPVDVDPAGDPAYLLQRADEPRIGFGNITIMRDGQTVTLPIRHVDNPAHNTPVRLKSEVDMLVTGRKLASDLATSGRWGCNESPPYHRVATSGHHYPKSASLNSVYDAADEMSNPFGDSTDPTADDGNFTSTVPASVGEANEWGCQGLIYIINTHDDVYTGVRHLTITAEGTSLSWTVGLQDNESPPVVFVSQSTDSVTEQAGDPPSNVAEIVFELRDSGGSPVLAGLPIAVNLDVLADRTTAGPAGYILESRAVIRAGESSVTTLFRANDNGDTDGDRTVVIRASLGDRLPGIELSADPDSVSEPVLTIVDNEAPGLVVVPPQLGFPEDAEPAFLNLSLASRPTDETPVVVSVPDADTAVLRETAFGEDMQALTLLFTPANWSAVRQIAVAPVFDPRLRDRDTMVTVAVDPAELLSADPYTGVEAVVVPVAVANANLPDYEVSPRELVIDEKVGLDGFDVVLSAQPLDGETVALSVSVEEAGCAEITLASGADTLGAGDCIGGKLTLTFTPQNWDRAQRVEIRPVDDDVDRNDAALIRVAYDSDDSSPADAHSFDELRGTSLDVQVVLEDDDSAMVRLHQDQEEPVAIGEVDIGVLIVRLNSRPEDSVTITAEIVAEESALELTDNPPAYRVQPGAWDSQTLISIAGLDDDFGFDRTAMVVLRTDESADAVYREALPFVVEVLVETDERPGLDVSVAEVTVAEPSVGSIPQRRPVSVALSARPVEPVDIEVVSQDPGEVSVSLNAPQRILPEDWDRGFTFTVFGVNDDSKGDDQGVVEIAVEPGGTNDPLFIGVPASTVLVTVTDNEQAGFLLFQGDDELFEWVAEEEPNSNDSVLGVRLQAPPEAGIDSVEARITVRGERVQGGEALLAIGVPGLEDPARCVSAEASVPFASTITVAVDSTQVSTLFTLCAVDDDWLRPDAVTLRVESLTAGYAVDPPRDLPVRIQDDERAAVSFHSLDAEGNVDPDTPLAELTIPESGAESAAFGIRVEAPPPEGDFALFQLSVCEDLTVDCPDRRRVSLSAPFQLVFPATTQALTVTGVDNRVIEATPVELRLFTLVSSAYPPTLEQTPLRVNLAEDDVVGFDVPDRELSVAEGASAAYQLILLSCPQDVNDEFTDVVVTARVDPDTVQPPHDGAVRIEPSILSLDCDDAGVPQDIQVTAVDDQLFQDRSALADAYRIDHELTSSDADYDEMHELLGSVSVRVTDDNDRGAVRLRLAESEDGAALTLSEADADRGAVFFVEQDTRSGVPAPITLGDAPSSLARYGDDYEFALDDMNLLSTDASGRPVVTLPPNALRVEVTALPVDDEVYEAGEIVVIRALAAGGISQLSSVFEETQVSFAIEDDEGTPSASLRLSGSELQASEIDTVDGRLIGLDALPERGPLDAESSFEVSAALSHPTTQAVGVVVRLVTDVADLPFRPGGEIDFADPSSAEPGSALPDYAFSFVAPDGERGDESAASSLTFTIEPTLLGSSTARFALSRTDNDLVNELLWLEIEAIQGAATVGAPSTAAVLILEDVEAPAIVAAAVGVEINGVEVTLSWLPARDTGTETAGEALRYTVFIADRPFEPLAPGLRGSQRIDELTRQAEEGNGLRFPVPSERIDALVDGRIVVVLSDERLLPLKSYRVVVAVQDIVGNVSLYGELGTAFATDAAVDVNGDGLADHLRLDGLDGETPADDDGDGLSNAVERYLARDLGVSAPATAMSALSDTNANGIPDAVEVRLGLPANPATADVALGDPARPVIGLPDDERDIAVTSAGLYTPVPVAVSARDGDDALQATPYFRRGALCGARDGDLDRGAAEAPVLPATYRTACREVPRRQRDGALMLRPGSNRIWWIAVDAQGNWPLGGATSQTVNVLPQVSFQRDHRLPLQAGLAIVVALDGDPVFVDGDLDRTLSLGFRVDSDDAQIRDMSNIQDPQIVAFPADARTAVFMGNSGQPGSAVLNLVADEAPFAQDPDSIDLAVDRVVLGVKPQMQVLTVPDNLPPLVRLSARQGNEPVVGINPAGAAVLEARADVIDADAERPMLTWDWSATSPALSPVDESILSFQSKISDLLRDAEPGTVEILNIEVSVSDGVHTVTRRMPVRVERAVAALDELDSDGDGVSDADEGRGDADTDGIPNYLDALTYDAHVLQTARTEADAAPDPDRALLATRPGLRLTLGSAALGHARETGVNLGVAPDESDALRTQRFTARLPLAAVDPRAEVSGEPVASDAVGVFDFAVDGIGPGDSVAVTLPLAARTPPNAGYVHYRAHEARWQLFESLSEDTAASLPGEPGLCPGPEETAWVGAANLSEGHWCVRLRVRDGGPNDLDASADGSVAFRGGFADVPVSSGILVGDSSGSGAGAGCALAQASAGVDLALALALVAAALCALARRRAAASALALALAAALPGGARAEESWREWGAGASGLWRGAYAGAGLASTEVAPGVFGPRYRLGSTRDTGPRLAVGYRLARHWALEAFWADLGEAEILDLARAGAPASATYRQRGMLVSYRRARPEWLGIGRGLEGLGIAWGWFVSAGWADQDAECRGCEFAGVDEGALTLGVGVDLATPGPWTVRVHYERYGDDSSAAALSWLFGAAAPPRGGGGR